MKKTVKLFLILTLCLTLCTALVACGEETPVICQHRDIDDNSLCDKCGESYTDGKDVEDEHTHICQHRDMDDNSLCDKCGESYTDGKDVEDEHTHNFTLQSTHSKYLATEADCVNPATYYFFCPCGETDTETYESGNALGHNRVGITCERCGIVMPSEGLNYIAKPDGTYRVSGIGTCTDTDILIPLTYNGKAVTSIGNYAFHNCSSLTSVTIPDSVTSIGDWAFYGCSALTSVTIPDSVTSIGDRAFSRCSSLTSITVAPGNANYGSIDGNLYTIGGERLIQYAIGKNDTSFIIPDNVTSIGDYAFEYCYALTSVTIPNSVTFIGDYAFRRCESLTSVTIGDSVTSIGDDAFLECSSLTSVTIGNSVTSIGDGAFSRCSSLTSVTIPDSVTSIGDDAFYGCEKLVEVINHSSLNITKGSTSNGSVGYYAKIVHSGESVIVNKDNYLFITADGVNYLVNYIGNDTVLTLPESYNGEGYEVYKYAFYYNDKITSVTIPDSVTSIGDDAFSGCSALTSVTIGDNVTSIGFDAFRNCSSLTSVTIGDSVTSIGEYAFSNCTSLTSVTIPDSVTSIGYGAFYYCNSLTRINYSGTKAEWKAISKGYDWKSDTGSFTVYCSDGNLTKSEA